MNRCPHCGIAHPTLQRQTGYFESRSQAGLQFVWAVYCCKNCGHAVLTGSLKFPNATFDLTDAMWIYPELGSVDETVPDKPRSRLNQAKETLSSPSASILMSGAAIDWMLKDKGYKIGSLYDRIDKAAAEHLFTEGMKEWAHAVRLEANIERHADEGYSDPNTEDAKRALDFAMALAEILYVLPERARQGRKPAQQANP